MKRSLSILVPAVALAAIVASCGGNKKDDQPATVSKYVEHRDPKYNFSVRYPENWAASTGSPGVAAFYSTQVIAKGFTDFNPAGDKGAKIEIGTTEGGPEKITEMIAGVRDMLSDPNNMKAPEDVTLNGLPARKVNYAFTFEDGSKFTAERYFVASGGVVTFFETAVIGEYDAYKSIFDTVRASFVPGQIRAATPVDTAAVSGTTPPPVRDSIVTEAPDENLKTHSAGQFSIGYPGNFSAVPSGSGASFVGARNDSKVQVDVRPAQGMSIDEVQKAYAKTFKSAGQATSVGGQKGYVFSMSPNANVSRRVYVVVSGDNVFQITQDWFKPQANLYTPVFDKMIASFKAK
jgi:hypothetical protein